MKNAALILIILNLLFISGANAEESLPKLECEAIQVAGNFSAFIVPKVGEKIVLDLNRPQDVIQNGKIVFSNHGYISMNNMPNFKLEKILPSTHDEGGIRLTTTLENRRVNIEVLGHLKANRLDAWLVNEENHSKGVTMGMIGLSCLSVH